MVDSSMACVSTCSYSLCSLVGLGNLCQYVFQSSANAIDDFIDLEHLERRHVKGRSTKDEW